MTHVYFARAEAVDLVKIGRAQSVRNRVRDLGIACPVELNLVTAHAETELFDEGAVHRVFSSRRRKGEWFQVSDEEIELVTSQRSVNRINELHRLNTWQFVSILCETGTKVTTDAYLYLLSLSDDVFLEFMERAKMHPKPEDWVDDRLANRGEQNCNLNIRISTELREMIRRAAKKAGNGSESAWIRRTLEDKAQRELKK